MGNSSSLSGTIKTVSFWVYFNSYTSQYPVIVEKGSYIQALRQSEYPNNGWFTNGAGIFGDNSTRVPIGSWTHYAFVYGDSTISLYMNGVFKTSTSKTGGFGPDAEALIIGSYGIGAGYVIDGKLDEVRMYNRTFSAQEVSQLYNSTDSIMSAATSTVIPTTSIPTDANAEKAPSPVAYWKFDDGTGTNAQDSSQNNNDGTISGATWQTEDMCMSGKCLRFDGTDDVVTVANTVSNIQTVSFWVRPQTTSEQFIDLNGSAYIQSSSGTLSATGFTSPTIYVNGKVSSTITANQWQYVTVTTGYALSGSAIKIGQISTNYGQAFIDDVKIYPYARSGAQIQADYNSRGNNEGSSSVIASATQGARGNLSDGLVGYWKFDESSGTASAADSSGNGYTGTSASTTNVGAGKFGNARTFNGSTDVITSSITSTPLTSAYTISMWASAANQVANQDYLAFWPNGNASILLGKDAAGIFMQHSGYFYNQGTSTIANNTWYLVTFVWNGTVGNVYVNGEVKTRYFSSIDGQIGTPASGATPLTIGSRVTTSGSFSGSLDELRFYNRALSPKEVEALYNFAPGPKVYLKMDEKSGTSAFDSSGNGRTGTINGNPLWSTGKYGSGVKMDGTGDNITISDF